MIKLACENLINMAKIDYRIGPHQDWEKVIDGVEKKVLRAEAGETRVLIRIAAGKSFPAHFHDFPDEVFVLQGIYVDPQIEEGKQFGPGSYLYYPAETEHQATSPSGCEILVWNNKKPT